MLLLLLLLLLPPALTTEGGRRIGRGAHTRPEKTHVIVMGISVFDSRSWQGGDRDRDSAQML